MRILVLGPDLPKTSDVDIVWVPIIRIKPRESSSMAVLDRLESGYRVIAFTSPRAPAILALDALKYGVFERLRDAVKQSLVAVVGPETGRSVYAHFGVRHDIMPSRYTSSSLALELVNRGVNNVLLARSSKGLKSINEILSSHGVLYEEIHVYDELLDFSNISKVVELVENRGVDAVLLSSPLIADAFCRHVRGYIGNVRLYSIGPSTAEVARRICGVDTNYPEKYTYSDAFKLIKLDI